SCTIFSYSSKNYYSYLEVINLKNILKTFVIFVVRSRRIYQYMTVRLNGVDDDNLSLNFEYELK
ncbi:MAG: hypothetical protein KDD45_13160, partial [Bdellovibrionales bacterium]|nr:hypothetical protein [Bdellovibrionales bacterium]